MLSTKAVLGAALICVVTISTMLSGNILEAQTMENGNDMYSVPRGVETRWASMENPDAKKGAAATANFGRKGAACRPLQAGDSFVMAHAEGSGVVRRIWITISDRSPQLMRGIVIRMYWDGASKPAVEAPLGDFFCQPLGQSAKFENAWFDNPEGRSFNCRIPMPFKKSFKITATNESDKDLPMFFYDVNFTLGDKHGPDMCYFHAYYRRENPTTLQRDFEILPKVKGRGRFLGCSIGVIADTKTYGRSWWGEGEVKMYIDGDDQYPTLSGTGTEDYIATGWGQEQYAHLWHGCPIADGDRLRYGFYRLHGPDPVYFSEDIRVTIQQIGYSGHKEMAKHMREAGIDEIIVAGDGTKKVTAEQVEAGQLGLFEREDDWCATAYFYLDKPSNALPAIEPYEKRIAGL